MSGLCRLYESWEHDTFQISNIEGLLESDVRSKYFGSRTDVACFETHSSGDQTSITVGYFIGVDWLVEGKHAIIVAPKLNTKPQDLEEKVKVGEVELDEEKKHHPIKGENISINYFAMLEMCLRADYLYKEIDDLVQINWKAKEIEITQTQDWLSPLLVVKFLNALKSIVKKGLKKGYYPVTKNLNGRIKGKILVGQNIKQNVVKNRFTNTICQYEEYSIDNAENRLLHKAFRFAISYLENFKKVLKSGDDYFDELANYCRPAFEMVGSEISVSEIKQFKSNPFFKEYSEGIHLAKLILKRYGYTISNTTSETVSTPPYWIDMPRLFELYVYQFLKTKFNGKNAVKYQFRTYGNALDFLVNDQVTKTKMVVDAKYKPLYRYGVVHQDVRQVAGYARLTKVYNDLEILKNQLIPCLIVYPDIINGVTIEEFERIDLMSRPIIRYQQVYKIGIMLPVH